MNDRLTFEAVCFRYPKSDFALEHIGFSVGVGECLALSGPNGGGKTTLGKLAAGILRPSGGRILIGGQDIARLSLGQIGQRAGYLFQDPARQLFAPTVLEDLTFPAMIAGEENADAAARGLLARLGLSELEDHSVFTLSGGEKQRLALAGILMRRPGLLILDEPTTGLDPAGRDRLGDLIGDAGREGTAVLLITHDLEFAARHAGRRLCLDGGMLI